MSLAYKYSKYIILVRVSGKKSSFNLMAPYFVNLKFYVEFAAKKAQFQLWDLSKERPMLELLFKKYLHFIGHLKDWTSQLCLKIINPYENILKE